MSKYLPDRLPDPGQEETPHAVPVPKAAHTRSRRTKKGGSRRVRSPTTRAVDNDDDDQERRYPRDYSDYESHDEEVQLANAAAAAQVAAEIAAQAAAQAASQAAAQAAAEAAARAVAQAAAHAAEAAARAGAPGPSPNPAVDVMIAAQERDQEAVELLAESSRRITAAMNPAPPALSAQAQQGYVDIVQKAYDTMAAYKKAEEEKLASRRDEPVVEESSARRRRKFSTMAPEERTNVSVTQDQYCTDNASSKSHMSATPTLRELFDAVADQPVWNAIVDLLESYVLILHFVFSQPAFPTFYGTLITTIREGLSQATEEQAIALLSQRMGESKLAATEDGDTLQSGLSNGIAALHSYVMQHPDTRAEFHKLLQAMAYPIHAVKHLSAIESSMKRAKDPGVAAVARLGRIILWLNITMGFVTSMLSNLTSRTRALRSITDKLESEPQSKVRDLRIFVAEYILCRAGYDAQNSDYASYMSYAYHESRGAMHITWSDLFFQLLQLALPCKQTSQLFNLTDGGSGDNAPIYSTPRRLMINAPDVCVSRDTRDKFQRLGQKAAQNQFMDESYAGMVKQLADVTRMEL